MSSTACSYQLPELPSFLRSFEVHTNRHCRNVSIASEAWLTRGGFGGVVPATTTAPAPSSRRRNSGSTRSRYRGAKIGLLAALCYPACDAPQLRLATDFLSLLVLEGGHALLESEFNGSLQRDLQTRLSRLHPPPSFHRALTAFRTAYAQALSTGNTVPDLESYIELRRDLSGLRMAFALIGSIGGVPFDGEENEDLARLTRGAVDVIAWAWDIQSYGGQQSISRKNLNLLTVLMSSRGLSLQAALGEAGVLVSQSVAAFMRDERVVLAALDTGAMQEGKEDDVRAYIRGLRACVVGAVEWGYENDMWFSGRGDEVREFGWVFWAEG